jgi:hypothetical protein
MLTTTDLSPPTVDVVPCDNANHRAAPVPDVDRPELRFRWEVIDSGLPRTAKVTGLILP